MLGLIIISYIQRFLIRAFSNGVCKAILKDIMVSDVLLYFDFPFVLEFMANPSPRDLKKNILGGFIRRFWRP